ncbi:spinocerebellar ataxia type 10 protein domain-containing protein [Trametes maxima]|nr:spinocerebellar ataxia type 10 protein domain-containing protein [Trametes maxima]
MDAAVRRIAIAAEALDPDNTERVRVLADVLDEYAPILANDTDARRNIGNATSPSIWPTLSHLWNLTSAAHTDPDPDDEPRLLSLCVSLARFTRNLVACEPSNQQRAFVNERAIRSLIYHYTSFNATQNPNSFPATRMLSQTLSNIITGNDALSQTLWSTYVNLPEEQLVLTRLFASPDARTVTSAFVLVLNCVHESTERAELLTRSPRGPRICLTMLDRIAALFEAEEASEEGRAFDIGYEVFERLVETGLVPDLYIRLSVEGEVVTPHQTTLLKLVDSYLFASQHAYEAALPRRPGAAGGSLFDVLTNAFLELSSYTQQSIQRAIASDGSSPAEPQQAEANPNVPPTFGASLGDISPLQNLDLLLPKVCEALVLVTQCLTTVALRAEEAVAARQGGESAQSQFVQASPKDVLVTAAASTGQGFVESLIETLRLVDAFVPRITYGRLVKRPPPPGSADTDTLAQEKPTAAAPDAGGARTPAEAAQDARTAQAFAHVKRDLVRLLGVLASENRAVQDRVRVCGGIPVVMNLCVVDDYNPYLREHAIFALRNLLFGNAESQAVVDAIKPVGKWDEQKVLRDLRGGEA